MDEGNQTAIAAIAERQVEIRKYLPAEEDEKTGDVDTNRKYHTNVSYCGSFVDAL